MGDTKNTYMKIVEVPVGELKPAEYNPRHWNRKAINDLMQSIREFGLVDPIIVNSATGRKNVVIGGHFRLKVCKDLDYATVPVVYVDIPDLEKEKELNLRLNKNQGEFDWVILKEFDRELLLLAGFEQKELDKHLSDPEEAPEVPFSEELLLEHNYIILYFDNALDWQVAQEKFGLKKVKDLIPRKGQPTGVGRVIKGKEWLNKIS